MNERFAAAFLDWWGNQPIEGEGDLVTTPMDDLRSFMEMLSENDLAIVEVQR